MDIIAILLIAIGGCVYYYGNHPEKVKTDYGDDDKNDLVRFKNRHPVLFWIIVVCAILGAIFNPVQMIIYFVVGVIAAIVIGLLKE